LKQNTTSVIYDLLYEQTIQRTDSEIINWWKYYQSLTTEKDDVYRIGISVCEDILRQRENYYLDHTYPKD
jgi:hypothetical protein